MGKPYKDYGQGLYCTEHIELAKEWACNQGTNGIANHYVLSVDGLRMVSLMEENEPILSWLALLMQHRVVQCKSPVEERGRQFLLEHFLPDLANADVIVGYRTDDSYFRFVRSFLSNTISLEQLSVAMRLGKPGEQVVLISQKAFDQLSFVNYEIADADIYFAKRKVRDEQARKAFDRLLLTQDDEGVYLRDLRKGGKIHHAQL